MTRISSLFCIVLFFVSCISTTFANCQDEGDCVDCYEWCSSNSKLCSMAKVRPLCRRTCHVCSAQTKESSWSSWDDSSSCSKDCGGGVKTQTRTCTGTGTGCPGESEREVSCNTQECAVWSKWTWTECSASCGGGSKNGSRTCLDGHCLGMTFTIVACNQQSCTETKWVPDGPWSPCPVTCGGGVRRLKKKCVNGRPGDRGCPMKGFAEIRACNLHDCPTWSEWTYTGECPARCGPQATRTKTRTCSAAAGGCAGPATAKELCPLKLCPIFKQIEEVGSGGRSECSASCGGGLQTDVNGETQICNTQPCPSWSSWSASACSKTCGLGSVTKTRSCPVKGACPGPRQESESCVERFCMGEDDIDNEGEYKDGEEEYEEEEWTSWSGCSVTCGGGRQQRVRGEEEETQECNTDPCPGVWDTWSPWSPCSATCGGGEREATRQCRGERECEGEDRKSEECNQNPCPLWSSWDAWSECSESCGGGLQQRLRRCLGAGSCDGSEDEARLCNIDTCSATVTDWTECSVSCGNGVQQRYENEKLVIKVCNLGSCHSWGSWSQEWSSCSQSCGGGIQIKTRSCSSGVDEDCEGANETTQACNIEDCPTWSVWSDWSACTEGCGGGNQTSTRKCNTITRRGCEGEATRTQSCNTQPCLITTEWSECSQTCGSGTQTRVFAGIRIVQACTVQSCPTWTEWGEWSACNATCGQAGVQRAERSCQHGGVGDEGCDDGETIRTRGCNGETCAHWGPWSTPSGCSVTCGDGLYYSKRQCVGGEIGDGECVGKPIILKPCKEKDCPHWSAWTSTECSRACGGYVRHRRHCVSGRIGQFGCIGLSVKFESCGDECAQWSRWSELSACDVTCGEGVRTRTRTCLGGEPGEEDCIGESTELKKCFQQNCNPCEGLKNGKSPWCVLANYYTTNYMCTTFAPYMEQHCPLTCCKVHNNLPAQ